MKEEALAKDTKLSKAFEHDKDPETVMLVAAGVKGSGVSNKPYRYIENYSLKDVKVWICADEEGWIPAQRNAWRRVGTQKPMSMMRVFCCARASVCGGFCVFMRLFMSTFCVFGSTQKDKITGMI